MIEVESSFEWHIDTAQHMAASPHFWVGGGVPQVLECLPAASQLTGGENPTPKCATHAMTSYRSEIIVLPISHGDSLVFGQNSIV